MPNHVHCLIGYTAEKKSINTIIGNEKRFIAYDIINRLKELNNHPLLEILSSGVIASDKLRGKQHEVFERSFDVKLRRTYKFVNQKLVYIHSNPVSKKWNLAADPTDYIHSSATFYYSGVHGIYTISNVNDWIHEKWGINGIEN